jgi:hypothetical protein
MPTAYERDTKLDAPDAGIRAILLKPPYSWTEEERNRMASRMHVEDNLGLGAGDANSVRYGLGADAGVPGGAGMATPTLPAAQADKPKTFRGGSPEFEQTMDRAGAARSMLETDDEVYRATLDALMANRTKLPEQTPGAAYVPRNQDIGITPQEAARGGSATVSKVGTPGQYGVNSLPQGFTSYQNRDGGWTVIGPYGKPMRFANEADAAGWLNGTGQAPAPIPARWGNAQLGQLAAPQTPQLPQVQPGVAGAPAMSTDVPRPGGSGKTRGYRGEQQVGVTLLNPPPTVCSRLVLAPPPDLARLQAQQRTLAPIARQQPAFDPNVFDQLNGGSPAPAPIPARWGNAQLGQPGAAAPNLRPPTRPAQQAAQQIADRFNPFRPAGRRATFPLE